LASLADAMALVSRASAICTVARLRGELVSIDDEMTLLTSAGGDIYAAV
jgi:hypothetical protein